MFVVVRKRKIYIFVQMNKMKLTYALIFTAIPLLKKVGYKYWNITPTTPLYKATFSSHAGTYLLLYS